MRGMGLTRRKAGILVFAMLIFFTAATILRILEGSTSSIAHMLPAVIALLGAFLLLFALFLARWEAAGWITIAVYALFTGFGLPPESYAVYLPISLLMPVIAASVLTDWRGIVASGVLVFGLLALRRGDLGFASQTVPVLNYLACVLGILASWLIQDRACHDADASAATLERLNRELETRIAARTSELETANRELGAANEELSRTIGALEGAQTRLIASERSGAVGRLSANLSHELNNPLGAIRSSAGAMERALEEGLLPLLRSLLALEPADRGRALELLEHLLREEPSLDPRELRERRARVAALLTDRGPPEARALAEDLAALGDEGLLARLLPLLSRPEGRAFAAASTPLADLRLSGRLIHLAVEQASGVLLALQRHANAVAPEEPRPLDLREELETLLRLYEARLAHRVVVERRFGPDSRALARAADLQLIAANLIDNALDAMKYRGRLRVETRVEDDFLALSIGDSGPGILREDAERVFEAFFTTKERAEGTGLGLGLAKRAAEAGGGSLSFRSEPGDTVFTLRLPRPGD